MKTLSMPLIALAGLSAAVLMLWQTPDAAARAQPTAACTAPASAAGSVPAEYFFYHALVAPHAALTPPASGVRSLHASCPSKKVIRT
jgi:hypothetical protein